MDKWKFYTSNEIKPAGWLRRQLEIQAEGLSGNLHRVWPDIRDSKWIGGGREGWERVPYWLDGFIPLACLLEDEEMISTAKRYVDAILAMQEDDGWICPCSKSKRKFYDTWAVQLITKTLKVYYDCSGDERIPDVLSRILKNYYELLRDGEIRLFGWAKYRWFETFLALNFLDERFGEDWIRDLAQILKDRGFDYGSAVGSWEKPRRLWRRKTHIVNLAMMLKSEAVSHDLLGEGYADEAERFRRILDRYNGTAFEGFTGDEVLAGLDPTRGTELCAVVEQMFSYELLFAHTGENRWAEKLEALAFNALPATLDEDMRTHQYVQMVNQIACQKTTPFTPFGTNGPEAHLFGLEPNFGCCTANFNQGWPKLALAAFLHDGNTIISSVMLPCVLKDQGVTIRLETEYPFRNRARYLINTDRAFSFMVRIPSFAKNVVVNGTEMKNEDLRFEIRPGRTEISVGFDTVPVLLPRPNGLFALRVGSLLFSVPVGYDKIPHEYTKRGVERKYPYCDYQLVPKSDWNYAFADTDFTVSYADISDHPFSQSHPPVTVRAEMQKIDWGLKFPFRTVCRKTPKSQTPVSPAEEIALIPYGCAKLRMTEMPKI